MLIFYLNVFVTARAEALGFHRLSKAETKHVHNAVAVGKSNLHYRKHFPDFPTSARVKAEQAAVGAPE